MFKTDDTNKTGRHLVVFQVADDTTYTRISALKLTMNLVTPAEDVEDTFDVSLVLTMGLLFSHYRKLIVIANFQILTPNLSIMYTLRA